MSTKFVIKYDLIDENGNSLMTGSYSNALEIPVKANEMNDRDCVRFTHCLMDFISRYAASPLIYPFFPQIQDRTEEELQNNSPYRYNLVFPEFRPKSMRF